MVWIITGYDLYECPVHGQWHIANSDGDHRDERAMPCPFRRYDGWKRPLTLPCGRASTWLRYQDGNEPPGGYHGRDLPPFDEAQDAGILTEHVKLQPAEEPQP